MTENKSFFKTKEFRLFLTVWLVYIFYLQMYGNSCMANSQSALTAAIVNEGRFEIDTYRRTSCDIAFYHGNYYSGMPPGISFLSIPPYITSKPIFYMLPQGAVDSLFEKLESYGDKLPADYEGKKKMLSNYFPNLSKREILAHIFISGFILPIFTTSLISAIAVVLLYSILKRFTGDERLRMLIALFYAFGTLIFPLSTEFFQRSIAAALMFAAFFILFKVGHKELKPEWPITFVSGLMAGFSAWFDYFQLFISGILFFYLLSFYIKGKAAKIYGTGKFWIFDLDKKKILLLLSFIIGVSISIILLFTYYYIVFDDPFTTSYNKYRIYPENIHQISAVFNMKLPSPATLFHISGFFLYSPIILLAFYGAYRAFLKKDEHYKEVLAVIILVAFTLAYGAMLAFAYPSILATSFKRYVDPLVPFIFIFLPYIFTHKEIKGKNIMKTAFFILGVISFFFNWTAAQYGAHQSLTHFDLGEKQFTAIEQFFEYGPSSSFLRALAGILSWNTLYLNLAGLSALALLILLIWKRYLIKNEYV